MSVDGMLLRRVLSATERNALITQMHNGNGPTARTAGAKALDLTLDEYDDLVARAKEKIEKAAARERADDAAAQFGRPPVRPIEEVAMEAAGVEDEPPEPREPVRPEPDTPPMRTGWTPTPGTNAARILAVLQRQSEPMRQSHLATAAGIRPGSIVDAVWTLEREGYAECAHGAGRGVFWQVTELGSQFGVEQPSGTETTAAPDDDGGRGGVPHDATAAASSAPDQPERVEESGQSAAGTAAGLPSANEPTADDEATPAEDAPAADEDREWAAERMAEADTGQGDPHELAGRATHFDPADFRHPPSMLPAVAEGMNGRAAPIGVEVELQGPTYRDLYVYTLLRKIEEDDGSLGTHIYDRIERQIEVAADG